MDGNVVLLTVIVVVALGLGMASGGSGGGGGRSDHSGSAWQRHDGTMRERGWSCERSLEKDTQESSSVTMSTVDCRP